MAQCSNRMKASPLPPSVTVELAKTHPTFKYRLEKGAQCTEQEGHQERDGKPHRNGELSWWDPPLILVGGEPVPPITEREQALIDSIGREA